MCGIQGYHSYFESDKTRGIDLTLTNFGTYAFKTKGKTFHMINQAETVSMESMVIHNAEEFAEIFVTPARLQQVSTE